jgi:hypothetical protein
MKSLRVSKRAFAAMAALLAATSGCAEQRTGESKIYRVASADGKSANYYRVRIDSKSLMGETQYKTGFYPAYAVDAYLGQTTSMPLNAAEAEDKLRAELVEAQKQALKNYFDAAKNPDDSKAMEAASKRLGLVRSLPDPKSLPPGTVHLGFSPIENLIDHNANKKFVIALSGDPDAVLQKISAIAEEPATINAIKQAYAGLLIASNVDEVRAGKSAQQDAAAAANRLRLLAGGEASTVEEVEALARAARAEVRQ